MTDAYRSAVALLYALKEAAYDYVDATERGESEPLAGLRTAAMLRLAAKAWVRADRSARQERL